MPRPQSRRESSSPQTLCYHPRPQNGIKRSYRLNKPTDPFLNRRRLSTTSITYHCYDTSPLVRCSTYGGSCTSYKKNAPGSLRKIHRPGSLPRLLIERLGVVLLNHDVEDLDVHSVSRPACLPGITIMAPLSPSHRPCGSHRQLCVPERSTRGRTLPDTSLHCQGHPSRGSMQLIRLLETGSRTLV